MKANKFTHIISTLIINPLKGLFFKSSQKNYAQKNFSSSENNEVQLLEKIKSLEKIIEEEVLKTEKLKSQFLNNVYHEIRTPMNSIIGFSELLRENDISESKKIKFIDLIKESSENFLTILDQLLEASIIESGNIELMKDSFEIEELYNEIYSFFNYKKHLNNKTDIAFLKITDNYYPGLMINSDPIRLRQILFNLIDNAFKFTDKGVIEFGYKLIDNHFILFHVSDSGNGIQKIDEPLIFQNFYKSSFCYGSANKGLGLGLCISKNLVKLLGGKMWIETNNFNGTTFKFTIPLEKPVLVKEKEPQMTSKVNNVMVNQ